MRGTGILRVLEVLEDAACGTAEMVDIMTSGYGESYRRMRRKIAMPTLPNKPKRTFQKQQVQREKQNIYSRVSYLKKQGFIEKKNSKWYITSKGKRRKQTLEQSNRKSSYVAKHSDSVFVIAFDVPEKERWKRDWLRSALSNMGFELLQQSVWGGKQQLAKQFVDDIVALNIAPYVEIFSVNKTGTLTKKHFTDTHNSSRS